MFKNECILNLLYVPHLVTLNIQRINITLRRRETLYTWKAPANRLTTLNVDRKNNNPQKDLSQPIYKKREKERENWKRAKPNRPKTAEPCIRDRYCKVIESSIDRCTLCTRPGHTRACMWVWSVGGGRVHARRCTRVHRRWTWVCKCSADRGREPKEEMPT